MAQRTTASGRRRTERSATAAAQKNIEKAASSAPVDVKNTPAQAESVPAPAPAAQPTQAVAATPAPVPESSAALVENAAPAVKKAAPPKKTASTTAKKSPAAPKTASAQSAKQAPAPELECPPAAQPADKEADAALAEYLEHGKRVAALSATLFDATAPLHALSPVWRTRLLLAAQWHDLGMAEGRKGHHKASMRIILADQKLQVSDEDRPYVALLARYHRKAWPALHHRQFAELSATDQRDISLCAALLRVADGLDWTHSGSVSKLEVQCKKHRVALLCSGSEHCVADMARALRKGDLFMKLFDRNLTCQIR